MTPLKRGALLITGALLAGGAGVWFGDRHLEQRARAIEAELRTSHATRAVIVAREDLPKGARLTRERAALRDIPERFVHEQALAGNAFPRIAGRTLNHPLSAGRAVLPLHVVQSDRARLADQIRPGDRAITIPVSGGAAIAGLLSPGDRVDLMLTHRDDGERATLPLLADIPLLATGDQLAAAPERAGRARYDNLTLAVSPVEAARITQALAVGSLHVVLRADADDAPVAGYRIDTAAITRPSTDHAAEAVELIIGGAQ